jgi:hypothetical protein
VYKLSTKPDTVIRLFDNAFIQFNELNPDYVAYLDWVSLGNQPAPADIVAQDIPSARMLGIEFQGVMCSATKEDQDGLLAVLIAYQLQGDNFQPTRYDFQNGSKLTITKQNIQQFIAVWMPFRQSFFVPT